MLYSAGFNKQCIRIRLIPPLCWEPPVDTCPRVIPLRSLAPTNKTSERLSRKARTTRKPQLTAG